MSGTATTAETVEIAKIPGCTVLKCTCNNPGQDKMYGKGRRVFNAMARGGKHIGYRCTVCGRETTKE